MCEWKVLFHAFNCILSVEMYAIVSLEFFVCICEFHSVLDVIKSDHVIFVFFLLQQTPSVFCYRIICDEILKKLCFHSSKQKKNLKDFVLIWVSYNTLLIPLDALFSYEINPEDI